MTSISSLLKKRARKIDELARAEHQCLTAADDCFFLVEYLAGGGYSTPANDLMINFKIRPSELEEKPARRRYKDWACREIGAALTQHLSRLSAGSVVVPIPTSKMRDHPDYDDRLLRALALARPTPPLDIRELVKQKTSTRADHEGDRQSLSRFRSTWTKCLG